ncbi:hypothetical protein PDUR_01770 [Paenibacillus durus]|uniref:Uncharacterized protein n=1 Tax=Paenibacillus durus TaxID=44251 RepID=A0A089HIJ3_PAEDU|nr:hypothetical protein PDUR_01770 [Paenibacillus durus]
MFKFRIMDYIIVFILISLIGAVNIVKTDDYFPVIVKLLIYALIFSIVVGTITNLIFKSRKD